MGMNFYNIGPPSQQWLHTEEQLSGTTKVFLSRYKQTLYFLLLSFKSSDTGDRVVHPD